jgi:predicted RNase H-like HicB family nuclease
VADTKLIRFTDAVIKEGDWYVARCLEVEVTSQGDTLENSLSNLQEALELYFEDEPTTDVPHNPIIAPIDIEVHL